MLRSPFGAAYCPPALLAPSHLPMTAATPSTSYFQPLTTNKVTTSPNPSQGGGVEISTPDAARMSEPSPGGISLSSNMSTPPTTTTTTSCAGSSTGGCSSSESEYRGGAAPVVPTTTGGATAAAAAGVNGMFFPWNHPNEYRQNFLSEALQQLQQRT